MPIQTFANQRKITHLYHFTQVGNLPSILRQGLLPTDVLSNRKIEVLRNDLVRVDRTSGICLSIGFPNYKLFYPFRLKDIQVRWAVLKIKSNVLWENDCAFCIQNAAKAEVANVPLYQRKTLAAFQAMYDDFPGVPRATLGLPDNYPTHPQAEILAFQPIAPGNIVAIIFDNPALKREFSALNLPQQILLDGNYFYPRRDSDKWKANG